MVKWMCSWFSLTSGRTRKAPPQSGGAGASGKGRLGSIGFLHPEEGPDLGEGRLPGSEESLWNRPAGRGPPGG